MDTSAARKARGAFFTPPELCSYVADWAVRSPNDRVLEPSCGDAEFLLAAGERVRGLGGSDPVLEGLELHRESAHEARRRLALAGLRTEGISEGDFFDAEAIPQYDAVIGNPPYVRYQDFSGALRQKSRALALRHDVVLTALASSWAAFTIHAAEFVSPRGRLGLVLPAELLSVNYAAPVRSFLLRRFGHVRLVLFEERVFPGVLEEVVLLMAEGTGGTDHFELFQSQDLMELATMPGSTTWRPPSTGGKWLGALLSVASADAYRSATEGPSFTTLKKWGSTTLGMVTGDNGFFTLSPAEVARWRLRPDEVVPISPPGSKHLRGLSLTAHGWEALGDAGQHTYLFRSPETSLRALSPGARRFVAEGEATGVQTRYKCRVRSPWWRVPEVATPDLFFTYMNNEAPQFAANPIGAKHLNSVHGVNLASPYRRLGRSLLPLAALNTITLLGAELVGRAYGGGMLKVEPKEADLLPVPTPALVEQRATELRQVRPQVARLLGGGHLAQASALVDQALFVDTIGHQQLADLGAARRRLRDRRRARNGSKG